MVRLGGEFQRIALSATVRPLKAAADFAGGYRLTGSGDGAIYEKREVSVIQSTAVKKYSINIKFPADARSRLEDDSWWPVLVEEFVKIIRENRSTLFFTNSRSLSEKIARMINENMGENLVYSHHGSLSREIRLAAEEKFKSGGLRGIVATSTLELGIDISELDRVVLVQSPFSISSAIQRVGRSGHGVGRISAGTLFPTHGRDFLDAAVIADSITAQDMEEIKTVECPLDVLSQVILSMASAEPMRIDDVYDFIRTSYPYRNLSKNHLKIVIDMLGGKYSGTRVRELEPRVSIDLIDKSISAKKGARMLLYHSGGTIPDRGYFDLRMQGTREKIGELDEEFVWERGTGDSFALGVQSWRIAKITHNDVEVVPLAKKQGIIPFWKAESCSRDFHFAEKVGLFLEHADEVLDKHEFMDELRSRYRMDEAAALELAGFLKRQREATGWDLPHRHHLLLEHYEDPMNRSGSRQVIIHTFWGGMVNHPFALALSAAWKREYSYLLETFVNNDSILIMLPHEFAGTDLFRLVTPENMEELVREKLEDTGFFAARFRENAGRALLLPRAGFRRRMPLWFNRLRSKKLLDAVSRFPDFPILLETWRACLKDEFDLENLNLLLREVSEGRISVSHSATGYPSPFAGELIYRQTNRYMYAEDSPLSGGRSSLSGELLKEVASSSMLRPLFPEGVIKKFEKRIKRTADGYSPSGPPELLDMIKERFLIPMEEFDELLSSIKRDHSLEPDSWFGNLTGRAGIIRLPGASINLICAFENIPALASALEIDAVSIKIMPLGVESPPDITEFNERILECIYAKRAGDFMAAEQLSLEDIFLQWLSFYGPVTFSMVSLIFNLDEASARMLIESMSEDGSISVDRFRVDCDEIEICDMENLEMLLRMLRRDNRPQFEALNIEFLQLFIASWQGIVPGGKNGKDIVNTLHADNDDQKELMDRLEELFGYPAPAGAWEEFIFPARLEAYQSAWLDGLMDTSALVWYGCGREKISFALQDELDLFLEEAHEEDDDSSVCRSEAVLFFPHKTGKYGFFDIAGHSGMSTSETAGKVWEFSWKGIVSNDSYNVIRKGVLDNFSKPEDIYEKKIVGRSGFRRWKSGRQIEGNWFILPDPDDNSDPLEKEELVRERVRQLFRRYGILFREITGRETAPMGWSRIFRMLRLMELSGEILSGYFFKGIPGLQFISREAFASLNGFSISGSVYWMNAADPASLSGIGLECLKGKMPSRLPSTFFVFHGTSLVLTARRNGAVLKFHISPDVPYIPKYLSFFRVLMDRSFNPVKIITVKEINGVPAMESEYAGVMLEWGFVKNYTVLELKKKYFFPKN